ncbi:MAG: helix-turn-helix domain-containing protein [Phycisphaerales bacterium]
MSKPTTNDEVNRSIHVAVTPLLIDADGVAAMLGVSRRTVYSMQSTGELGPMALTVGGRRLWRTEELSRWVAAGCPRREVWLD